MPYAVQYEVPADAEMYRKVRAAMGPEQPKGLVAHLVVHGDSGLRHIGVWDSQDDWRRFQDERVQPAVVAVLEAAGIPVKPPEPPVQELELIDIWLGG